MESHDFQEYLKSVLFGEEGHGLSIYCCVKENGTINLKRFNVQDDFRREINILIVDAITAQYLSEDVTYDTVNNISDNNKSFFLVEKTDQYNPFDFFQTYTLVDTVFTENDRTNLKGFAFCFSINSKIVWAYQHVYPMSVSKKSKGLLAIIGGESIFNKVDNQKVFCIESRVDTLVVESTICPVRIKFLEQYFGFEVYIRDEAQNTVNVIESSGLIEDIEKFNDFIAKDKLTNAKKLLKIKHSPVLSMPPEIVIQRLMTITRYSNIKIEDGKIIATSLKDVSSILKMLNDDYLHSALSEKDYDSPAKKILSDA